ncbi:DUF1573 domain-containing protein [Mesonia aestuariivivens]|uniref:DUF1573 domain-containing protein n=1 Tax=Mesonia aestuariivivens TaxID=2796128 RepID=A0ABS6W3X0_9FLAO|nr:DUF1573 domain-containing protein [Mesonia aestuariivivens]MBW2961813.1 DUF1573 domain-containing protein [Mesonia aestuariivivens]
MKKGFLMLAAVAAIVFTSCKDEKAADKVNDEKVAEVAERDENAEGTAKMTFEEEMHDFGTINEGDVVEHTFKFTNDGDSPLVITQAKGSCGCTVPSWPKEPVAPGEQGEILVKFNSRNKPNNQMKTVRITTNTESGQEMIKIKAFVTPDADKAAAKAKS